MPGGSGSTGSTTARRGSPRLSHSHALSGARGFRAAAGRARASGKAPPASSGESWESCAMDSRSILPAGTLSTHRGLVRAVDIIIRKRDGGTLTRDEIAFAVAGVTAGTIPDYQASALLMAILLRGMSTDETAWLTDAMVHSGARVDLHDVPGVKVDKH